MPVFGTFRRRRGGVSHASRRAVRFRPPRNLQYSDAGSRWAYRGRPAHPYAQSARDTPRQHSLGGRDRCPVCAPGAAYAPDLLILSCWHPGKTGPRRVESRYQGRPAIFAPGEKCHGTLPAMFTGRKTGRGQQGPARLEALVTARRDVGTPAGLESGGNAEVSYA